MSAGWLARAKRAGGEVESLWLMESDQATPMDSIKDVIRSSVKVPEFDKHLKMAGGHIG